MWKKQTQLQFQSLLKNKKLPIVILDEQWHALFAKNKPAVVASLEKKLNELVKLQGRYVSEIKDLKTAKKGLMKGIVANMEVDNSPEGKLKSKKLDQSQKLINDINDKLKKADNELAEVPYQIKEINEKLIVEGMNICYLKMFDNVDQIKQMDDKITAMRDELKRMVIEKQEMEEENTRIYSYMHDILGSEVMEALDHFYFKNKK